MAVSYAFQIVGATYLLVNSFKKYCEYKNRQKHEPINNGELGFLCSENLAIGSDYTDAALSEFTKAISFLEICIGYILAILSPNCQIRLCCQLGLVILLSMILYIVNSLTSKCIEARLKKIYAEKQEKCEYSKE